MAFKVMANTRANFMRVGEHNAKQEVNLEVQS